MAERIVPVKTRLAARRAFVRTSAQALAASAPTGALTGLALSGSDLATVGWAVLAAGVSSVIAGGVAYLQMISTGIPEEYQPAPKGG